LERDKFDNKTVSFEEHIKLEHNIWNYLYFIVLVREKNQTDYTGPESYVAHMIKAMSLVVTDGDGEQNEMRMLQDKLVSTMKVVMMLTGQLNELKEQVNRRLLESFRPRQGEYNLLMGTTLPNSPSGCSCEETITNSCRRQKYSNLLKEDESRLDHSVSPCSQMSRFLDMKEFGEAARYLRLSNLEQLAARAQAFDGKPVYKHQPQHYDHSPNMACNTRSAMARLIRDRSLNLFVQNFPQILDLIWII
ncbi:hypothetical protein GOODEAATRI_015403, partial [Goodea atripinnis]